MYREIRKKNYAHLVPIYSHPLSLIPFCISLMKIFKLTTMNCSPTICIALLLLSLTAGMFLLYKTQKENLNTFFKIVSWFIIVVSFGAMICCTVCCIRKCCRQQCAGNQECGPGGYGECGPGGMNKRVMIYKGDAGECSSDQPVRQAGSYRGKGCCKDMMECEEGKKGCEEGEMDCCKKGGAGTSAEDAEKKCEMKVKKDSVVVKK